MYFAAPEHTGAAAERFVVTLNDNSQKIVDNLKTSGFIKSPAVFNFVFGFRGLKNKIAPGGYQISKSLNVWQVVSVLSGQSYMKWVVIPEGLRKEEISDLLAENLGWSDTQKSEWLQETEAKSADYFEGVYFPDTYLISNDETPSEVADRLVAHFEEVFAPFAKEALKQNIKWTTVLKLASIVQREAAGQSDMALIAGILWNRLNAGMPLDVDSTLQYARPPVRNAQTGGNTGAGWWAPITAADKKINSPYNTYLNKGLPPTPISNPGLSAIAAVLAPAKTDCLYYLHDASKIIHCAKTYEEHQKNIKEYLD